MTEGLTNIEEAFVLVQGAQIHYQRAGTGRPLLLLHGLVGSAKNWRRNTLQDANSARDEQYDNA